MTKSEYISDKALLEQLPVFYQPWYLDIFEIDWDVQLFEAKDQKWIFPYFTEKKAGVLLNRPPKLTPYYGPYWLGAKENSTSTIVANELITQEIAQFSKQFGVFAICPHFTFDFNGLVAEKMVEKARVTHYLDLKQSLEHLFGTMDYMRRKNVRKAEKELTIEEATFDVDTYFNWINATYQKRGATQPFSKSFFGKYVTTVLEHKSAIANTIFNKEGHAIAMSLVLWDKTAAYSILGANSPEHKHSAATTALLWRSIETAKALNVELFDFEGSSIPEIALFFSKFGSERVDYKAWEQTNSLIWKMKTKLLG